MVVMHTYREGGNTSIEKWPSGRRTYIGSSAKRAQLEGQRSNQAASNVSMANAVNSFTVNRSIVECLGKSYVKCEIISEI